MINIISIIGCITIIIVLVLILLLKNKMNRKNTVEKAVIIPIEIPMADVIIPIENNIPMAREVVNT